MCERGGKLSKRETLRNRSRFAKKEQPDNRKERTRETGKEETLRKKSNPVQKGFKNMEKQEHGARKGLEKSKDRQKLENFDKKVQFSRAAIDS